jgi:hypothetical protein
VSLWNQRWLLWFQTSRFLSLHDTFELALPHIIRANSVLVNFADANKGHYSFSRILRDYWLPSSVFIIHFKACFRRTAIFRLVLDRHNVSEKTYLRHRHMYREWTPLLVYFFVFWIVELRNQISNFFASFALFRLFKSLFPSSDFAKLIKETKSSLKTRRVLETVSQSMHIQVFLAFQKPSYSLITSETGVSRIRTDSDSEQIPIPNGFRFRTDFKSVWFRNLYGIGIRSDSRKKNQKMSKIENVIKLDE